MLSYLNLFPCLLAALPIPTSLESGTELKFSGTFVQAAAAGTDAGKRFELTYFVADLNPAQPRLFWTLEEQGHGGWSWPTRFGVVQLDARWRCDESHLPSLLYVREQGTSVVPMLTPLFQAERPLAAGTTWQEGKLEYKVSGTRRIAGVAAHQVDVSGPYGHRRSMWIDASRGVVVSLRERVFVGQGEEHELRFELAGEKRLSDVEASERMRDFNAMLELVQELQVEPRSRDIHFNNEQVGLLSSRIGPLRRQITAGPLAMIVLSAAQDAAAQAEKNESLAAIIRKTVGTGVGSFQLRDLEGKPIDQQVLAEHVTVLHFWEYRDTPLEEPYGQVGYLDFLHRRRGEGKLQVFGIAVDPRLQDTSARQQAIQGIKKFKSFMNLSYPVLVDDGTLLRKLGDPRTAGGELPLFVVIDGNGKVTHYHAGCYDVDPQQGLTLLSEAIKAAGQKGE